MRIEGLRVGWGNGWFGNSKIELKLDGVGVPYGVTCYLLGIRFKNWANELEEHSKKQHNFAILTTISFNNTLQHVFGFSFLTLWAIHVVLMYRAKFLDETFQRIDGGCEVSCTRHKRSGA